MIHVFYCICEFCWYIKDLITVFINIRETVGCKKKRKIPEKVVSHKKRKNVFHIH